MAREELPIENPEGLDKVQDEIDVALVDLIHETGLLEENTPENQTNIAIARAAYAKGAHDQYNDPTLFNRLNQIRNS